jgi:hypothetical protein
MHEWAAETYSGPKLTHFRPFWCFVGAWHGLKSSWLVSELRSVIDECGPKCRLVLLSFFFDTSSKWCSTPCEGNPFMPQFTNIHLKHCLTFRRVWCSRIRNCKSVVFFFNNLIDTQGC